MDSSILRTIDHTSFPQTRIKTFFEIQTHYLITFKYHGFLDLSANMILPADPVKVHHDRADVSLVELRVIQDSEEEGRHEEEDVHKQVHVTCPD